MTGEYSYREFVRREENMLRASYDPELEFYSVIRSGNVKRTSEFLKASFTKKQGLGILSLQPLQNYKYHLAITIALIARYCIEGGLELSTSFALSDYYIQKADACRTLEELDALHSKASLDYATRMQQLRKKKVCSKAVARCLDYIDDNLHLRITVEQLADYVKLSPSYLSKLFKQETGYCVSDYIQETKINTAKNMLLYSSYSAAEIASILAYPNQSYFTKIFHKRVGVTPKKYQSLHLREIQLGSDAPIQADK